MVKPGSVSNYDPSIHFPALGNGSESAFRAIFDHFRAPFYGAALKLTRSELVAEEIVQQCFVKLWEKRTLVAAADKPENYILTILHNLIYTHFRVLAKERALRHELSSLEESNQYIEAQLEAKEDQQLLDNLIGQLPEQQRQVYLLSKREGLSRAEVAKRMNLSPHTVRNHLAAAVRFILQHYGGALSAAIWAEIWKNL